jgi:hypothetical protein
MIDPAGGINKQPAIEHPALPARPEAVKEVTSSTAADNPASDQQKHAAPKDPVLDVRLDGETMRLYTELRDPETDRVIIRLPAAYHDSEERKAESPGTSIEA